MPSKAASCSCRTLATVTSASKYVQIDADGSSSKIDLSALTSLAVNTGYLTVTNQATILDPKLTSLTNEAVTIDGTGTMAVGQWTTLVSTSVEVTGGTTTLSSLTSVSVPSGYGSMTLEANGSGADLEPAGPEGPRHPDQLAVCQCEARRPDSSCPLSTPSPTTVITSSSLPMARGARSTSRR